MEWSAELRQWVRPESGEGAEPAAATAITFPGSGTLDGGEIFKTLSAHSRITETQARRMLEDADADKSGELDFEEFLGVIATSRLKKNRHMRGHISNGRGRIGKHRATLSLRKWFQ